MSKVYASPLAPPSKEDLDNLLNDYTSKIKEAFDELYQDSHVHDVRSSDPASNEGEVGDIVLVDDGTNKYLAVRYSDGWFKTANLTAI